ncbi:MAG: SHOCT domain-containing protein [Oscillospiraceae bacterium]|jgi:hypothetical protein|nr:SHOCT domain-containing protein [Oscillospiraceae bacterium]
MEEEKKFSKFFMEPTERFICALGNSFIQTFLADGTLGNGFTVVSDKRVYFKGKCLSTQNGKNYKYIKEERMVDVKDVTGTGYKRITNPFAGLWLLLCFALFPLLPFGQLLLGIVSYLFDAIGLLDSTFATILLVVVALAEIAAIVYIIIRFVAKRDDIFEIQFAGGKIAFNVKWYGKSEVDEFQRQLRLAKDSATAAVAVSNVVQAPGGSVADELQKLAGLLAQGLITQEEYDKAKSGLIKL